MKEHMLHYFGAASNFTVEDCLSYKHGVWLRSLHTGTTGRSDSDKASLTVFSPRGQMSIQLLYSSFIPKRGQLSFPVKMHKHALRYWTGTTHQDNVQVLSRTDVGNNAFL